MKTITKPLALAAAIGMIAITEVAYQAQRSALEGLVLEGQARLRLMAAFQRLLEAETGKRGYLLLHDKRYLQPYERAAGDVIKELDEVDRLDREGGETAWAVPQAKIRESMLAKLSEMKEVMRLHDEGRMDLAMEMVRSGIGHEQMQKLRGDVADVMRLRNGHIALGLDSVREIFLFGRIGVISLTVLSTLILITLILSSRRFDRERERQRRALHAERDRLEEEVTQRMADLRELTLHLQTAREDERARLARELHDELGALLTSAKLSVASLRPKLKNVPEAEPKLAQLVEALNAGIALKRRIIEDLSPSSLHSLGLVPALEILCSEMGRLADVEVVHQLQPVQVPPEKALAIYRFVQESLTNMLKYAQATRCTVRLRQDDGGARIEVWDNGQGFDARILPAGSHGLRGMRFRFEGMGGLLAIDSCPTEGTRLTGWLPLEDAMPRSHRLDAA